MPSRARVPHNTRSEGYVRVPPIGTYAAGNPSLWHVSKDWP